MSCALQSLPYFDGTNLAVTSSPLTTLSIPVTAVLSGSVYVQYNAGLQNITLSALTYVALDLFIAANPLLSYMLVPALTTVRAWACVCDMCVTRVAGGREPAH